MVNISLRLSSLATMAVFELRAPTFLRSQLYCQSKEVTDIMKDFDELGHLAPTNLHLGGTKFMVIQGKFDAVIRDKKESGGVTIKKTAQALIFGIYEEPMTPGQCNMVVERLGDYLADQGLQSTT
ncbi:hypothetical protein V6N13_118806 [Hibiscus sabdariffa]|uniref:Profilin n=1 Tax=Hibiscus sabdariffa TaxID=183260 RepID=A0ABR2DZQ0_9ROSI